MLMESVLFYLFSAMCLLSGFLVISATNPVYSVFCLILVFCNATGLFLLFHVEFIAMLFLMVYVGAVAVLFLFIVMMLNIKMVAFSADILRYLPVGALVGIIFFIEVWLIIDSDFITNSTTVDPINYTDWFKFLSQSTNIVVIGNVLYTNYVYFFIMASLVLLVAMIGAIVLTMYKRSNVRRQDIFQQLSRDFEQVIVLKK